MTDTTQDKIDQEYIRDGVKLADGFNLNTSVWHPEIEYDQLSFKFNEGVKYREFVLAALVAQLKSQVDKTKWSLNEYPACTIIYDAADQEYTSHKGEGRTMNSLKAILDSRVLVMKETG